MKTRLPHVEVLPLDFVCPQRQTSQGEGRLGRTMSVQAETLKRCAIHRSEEIVGGRRRNLSLDLELQWGFHYFRQMEVRWKN